MSQQEKLATEKAPVGGGYVCLTRRPGSDNWDFVFATKVSAEADQWWENQLGSARVWHVRPDGELNIRNAKS